MCLWIHPSIGIRNKYSQLLRRDGLKGVWVKGATIRWLVEITYSGVFCITSKMARLRYKQTISDGCTVQSSHVNNYSLSVNQEWEIRSAFD